MAEHMPSWAGFSHWREHSKKYANLRRMRSRLRIQLGNGKPLKLLFAGGFTWVLLLLLVCMMLIWSCGSVAVPSTDIGRCRKKSRIFTILDNWGLIPKPSHRCPIPVADNPYTVKIPHRRHNGSFPFSLEYIRKDHHAESNPEAVPLFGGYQTWRERNESFQIRQDMKVHCGFVGDSGADIDPLDKAYVRKCQFVVASGIFDGYDVPHQPSNISDLSRALFCFVMVVDQRSLDSIKSSGNITTDKEGGKWVGIWRLLLLKRLPYDEPRRNGKIPKLLTHRIFPDAEYSIWIDGKMELIIDPLLILERYLWRGGHKFAIARHKYHRSIYEEADANKRRKRYARPLIDKHMEIYKREGMLPWSDKKLPLPSDVPEGAIIIREHTPLTNLFSCLWFNEVNRFTPRDQLSFGYVVYRLNESFPFFMFPNCEYNSLFNLHKHLREHSSKVEWVKSLDELDNDNLKFEKHAGLGLFTPYGVDNK